MAKFTLSQAPSGLSSSPRSYESLAFAVSTFRSVGLFHAASWYILPSQEYPFDLRVRLEVELMNFRYHASPWARFTVLRKISARMKIAPLRFGSSSRAASIAV